MSKAEEIDIDHVSMLARLTLTPAEKEKYRRQLADVLHHIRQLETVDVSNVEPTAHAFPLENVWADDEPRSGFAPEEALRNAPAQRSNMIVVPKVVE
ncbi:MAG: Asp-tRNA(Asn)/Glu-tRNA(Gln) amidotransferase subunit GatC [Opitutaceae bacterium]|nr:Asp-tRNA(Asn)/Glu-tRNA(Gln) amidotransferase subunit GatC [Opitutaceae bacterium]